VNPPGGQLVKSLLRVADFTAKWNAMDESGPGAPTAA
jgi:hypothetical protein